MEFHAREIFRQEDMIPLSSEPGKLWRWLMTHCGLVLQLFVLCVFLRKLLFQPAETILAQIYKTENIIDTVGEMIDQAFMMRKYHQIVSR